MLRGVIIVLIGSSAAMAQQRSPVQAPADVKPTSITLEDVAYVFTRPF